MFNLLFRIASRTLLEFGQSRLEAQLGFTAVLHTWTRKLLFHPHLHCIVTGGGLNHLQQQWSLVTCRFRNRGLSQRTSTWNGAKTIHCTSLLASAS